MIRTGVLDRSLFVKVRQNEISTWKEGLKQRLPPPCRRWERFPANAKNDRFTSDNIGGLANIASRKCLYVCGGNSLLTLRMLRRIRIHSRGWWLHPNRSNIETKSVGVCGDVLRFRGLLRNYPCTRTRNLIHG